jgi:hypothetical protein
LVPSGQRERAAPLPSAAQVLISLAVAQVTAPGVQVGVAQAATPAVTAQVPPVAAQSWGASCWPAPSQRASVFPAQLEVLGVQAVPTGFCVGCWMGVLGFWPSGFWTGAPLVPAAPGMTGLVPPAPATLPKPGTPLLSGLSSALLHPAQRALMTLTLSRPEPTLAQRGCFASLVIGLRPRGV